MVENETFIKSFNVEKNEWKKISLTDSELEEVEKENFEGQIKLMKKCLEDVINLLHENISFEARVAVAVALFDKRAQHLQYAREAKAYQKYKKWFETEYGTDKK